MIILASISQRRKEIMQNLGFDFQIIPSEFEEYIDNNLPPEQIAADLAYGKGRDVFIKNPNDIIISGDTVVYFEKKSLGKAKDINEARDLLSRLSGSSCKVYTGNGFFTKGKVIVEVTIADVKFKNISKTQIEEYLNAPDSDWQDKVGSFAVQGKAGEFTEVFGEWSTVLGLSENFLKKILK